jgi:hypothetical protein
VHIESQILQDNFATSSFVGHLENDGRDEPPRQVGCWQGGETQPSSICPPTNDDATWIKLPAL